MTNSTDDDADSMERRIIEFYERVRERPADKLRMNADKLSKPEQLYVLELLDIFARRGSRAGSNAKRVAQAFVAAMVSALQSPPPDAGKGTKGSKGRPRMILDASGIKERPRSLATSRNAEKVDNQIVFGDASENTPPTARRVVAAAIAGPDDDVHDVAERLRKAGQRRAPSGPNDKAETRRVAA